ncbi:hypothetical protein ACOMHN_037768 [Nucella lapillus]
MKCVFVLLLLVSVMAVTSAASSDTAEIGMSESYGETTEAHYSTFTIYRVAMNLYTYLLPIIVCFGIFGNIMTIIIMREMKSGESTINIYFTAVAAMDLIYLCINTLPQWINYVFTFRLNTTHDVVCKISTWLYTGGSTIRCWYAVLNFISAICETLYHANSAINFYLYCLTGRRFREEFIKIMCCGKNRRQRGAHQ